MRVRRAPRASARMRARAADLELNYAARDFYYIPIQMTSAKTGVKPRARRSDDRACIRHLAGCSKRRAVTRSEGEGGT